MSSEIGMIEHLLTILILLIAVLVKVAVILPIELLKLRYILVIELHLFLNALYCFFKLSLY